MMKVFIIADFNPRAPCGARRFLTATEEKVPKFQSTCPLRGTTDWNYKRRKRGKNFNPRAPCGARPCPRLNFFPIDGFQSTCPLRGTTYIYLTDGNGKIFQSTCPLRGTTANSLFCYPSARNFNPRAPCGARHRKKEKSVRT